MPIFTTCRKPELTRPWQVIFCDLVTPEDDKPELLKPSYWIAKSYKMTFWRQEKSWKVTLIGQSHLRNPLAAENDFMLLW
jgi:hypothetical protein